MTELETDQKPGFQNRLWVYFFLFVSIQAIPVITRIVAFPRDPKNSFLFGLSLARLLLISTTFGIGLILLFASFISGRKKSCLRSIFQDRWRDSRTFLWLEAFFVFLLVAAWGVLVFLRSGVDGADNPVFQRFSPLLVWLFLLGIQFFLWLWFQNFGWHVERLTIFQPAMNSSLIVLIVFSILGLIIGLTGYGIIPDIFHWGNPGVPLLSWQVIFSLITGAILLTLMVSFPKIHARHRYFDWTISISLVVLAAGLWLSQPIPRSFFFPSPRPPTFEIYPYSDAGLYDYTSQSVLIGEGFFGGRIVTRPVYVLMLTFLHGLVGQDYPEMILLQTLILTLFPLVLYWLGRSLHSREAGLAAGLLFIFREINNIAATPLTEVSNSKMLMTDSLTGLGICLLCLLVIRWQRKMDALPIRSILIGGFLGLLSLLRSQATVLIPVVLFVIFVNRKLNWKNILIETTSFLLGVALYISPWVIRNGISTGDFALDQPSQAVYVAQRFSTSVEKANELHLEPTSEAVKDHILNFTLEHPVVVLQFVGAHFLNNELATLEVIPLNVTFSDFRDNFTVTTLFWLDGVSGIKGWQWLLLTVNLILLSIGIGSAWSKWKWLGIFPLGIHLAYSLSSAVARISGWRFIQPVDWVGYFYFCLGFAELMVWIFAGSNLAIRPLEKIREVNLHSGFKLKQIGITAFCVFSLGMMLPVAEWIIPKRYTPVVESAAMAKAALLPETNESIGNLDDFLSQPKAVSLIGRSLYPRWYKSGIGEPGSGWAAYKTREKPHLGFMLVGPKGDFQMILEKGASPEKFTHAADILIFGCEKPDYIDVRLVVGYNSADNFIYMPDNQSKTCE